MLIISMELIFGLDDEEKAKLMNSQIYPNVPFMNTLWNANFENMKMSIFYLPLQLMAPIA